MLRQNMTEKEIDILMDKYLRGTCTDGEKKILEDFLDSYQESSDNWVGTMLELEREICSGIQEKIRSENNKDVPKSGLNKYSFLKYAAVFLIGFFSFLFTNMDERIGDAISDVPLDSNKIVLELDDGTRKVIGRSEIQNLVNSQGIIQGRQEGNKLVYTDTKEVSEATRLTYNKLFVPYGERIQIVLSDGSIVHLNSGSNLRYPVRFAKATSREVFLDGEAYFEVSKDDYASFIVHSNDIDTKVYGTEFNISAYKNDDALEVVLVEGSLGVSVNKEGEGNRKEVVLVPNEKASFDKIGQAITTGTVQIEKYVLWKDGVLYFEEDRFENILRKLERHYNVSIQNNNKALNNKRFTGSFETETIDQVLKVFSNYSSFEYTLNGNIIQIN